ncbi:MAG: hypothetical protein RL581_570, partial [Actinomycetota bacterium]
MNQKQTIGKIGEIATAEYLIKLGFTI